MRNTRLVLVIAVAVCAVIIAVLLLRRDDRGIRHPTSGAGGTSNVVQAASTALNHTADVSESEVPPCLPRQESDSGLVRLEPGRPKPAHITRAQGEGARARITFLVVDDRGRPVPDATVAGGFYNHGRGDHSFSRQTRSDGTVGAGGTGLCGGSPVTPRSGVTGVTGTARPTFQ
jgi:protocatechuate 3,4-dioxygenase beta subunit